MSHRVRLSMRHFCYFVALGSFVCATFWNLLEKVWKNMKKYVTLYVFGGKEKNSKMQMWYLKSKK